MATNNEIANALEAVADDLSKRVSARLEGLRKEAEVDRRIMPRYFFEIYMQIRSARIEGIEWAAQEAGKAIMRQESVLGVKR